MIPLMSRSSSTRADSSTGAQPGSAQAFRFARLPAGTRIAWTGSGPAGARTLVRVAHWLTNVDYDLRSPIWRPWGER
jgi:hypothetical protein